MSPHASRRGRCPLLGAVAARVANPVEHVANAHGRRVAIGEQGIDRLGSQGRLLRQAWLLMTGVDAEVPVDVPTPTDVQAPVDVQPPVDAATPVDAAAPADAGPSDAPSGDAPG